MAEDAPDNLSAWATNWLMDHPQATLDETVHQENSLMLLDELLDKGKYADILLFPDRRDLFQDYGERLILFQRLTDFFVRNL